MEFLQINHFFIKVCDQIRRDLPATCESFPQGKDLRRSKIIGYRYRRKGVNNNEWNYFYIQPYKPDINDIICRFSEGIYREEKREFFTQEEFDKIHEMRLREFISLFPYSFAATHRPKKKPLNFISLTQWVLIDWYVMCGYKNQSYKPSIRQMKVCSLL